MSVPSSPFRVALALIIGLWAPLSCCCAAEATPETSALPAAASCHHEVPSPASHDNRPHHPCEGDGDCDCATHVAQARVSPDKPLTLATADGISFLLHLQPVALHLFDAAHAVLVLHETGPPPRPDNSLFALHCMLTI